MAEQAVKNVIFDMDGVIFDTERVYIECCIEAAKALPVPEEQVYKTCVKCIGTNEFQTNEFFRRDFSPFLTEAECQTLRDESVRLFKKRYTEKLIPMKAGVVELLEYLKEQGIRIGLASSTRKDIVERELADAGILHYFESVTGGDVVKIGASAFSVRRIEFWAKYSADDRTAWADCAWSGATDCTFATAGNWLEGETAATSLANKTLLLPEGESYSGQFRNRSLSVEGERQGT